MSPMMDRVRSRVKPSRTAVARIAVGVAAIAAILGVAACGGDDSEGSSNGGGTVNLVAYSTPQELYEQSIEPAFEESPDGSGVTFENSFGASGDQARAVESGLPADVVHLSLEPDMQTLVDAGLVAEDWADNEYDGIVQNSVVTFLVREGNPENIRDWDDLVTGDVEVLEPNPFTSGGAKWNIMAAYGAQLEKGKSPEEAEQYLAELFKNVPVLDKSARESLQTFSSGKGDVLLGYENEAILAQQQGEELDYIVPDQTILIENPVAVVNESKDPELANSFVDFLYTPEAQEIFVKKGYRPVVEGTAGAGKFPEPPAPVHITKFGGWDKGNTEFFDPEKGTVAEIFQSQGKSTE